MPRRPASPFASVRSEGALLPPSLLGRVAAGDPSLPGLSPEAYHLLAGERLGEAASRAWSRLVGAWAAFREARAGLGRDDPATSLTRERWLLPLFEALGYGRLQPARALEVEDRAYPVSHRWESVPVHLVGAGVDLDRRTPGVAGAARSSPHSMVQELLNASPEHLWAFVANGDRLRVLRDNASLTRMSYLEIDLEAMMEGEDFASFNLAWLLCHQSRVEGQPPESCWLERWRGEDAIQGTRALERLRAGVEAAIAALGSGLLAHPANRDLREALRSGGLAAGDYYRELLRLVYRLLFLLVAEDRDLLLDPDAPAPARNAYLAWYSLDRLRALAGRRRGTAHGDLWRSLGVVMAALGAEHGQPALGLPALGSYLWSEPTLPHVAGAALANRDLLAALRHLAFTTEEGALARVDYRNMGAEELGAVYESLLELHPVLDADGARFALESAAGHERKRTGSYYTPTSLVDQLLETALDPVVAQAARAPDPEAAVLALTVLDPACGSGHFLVAAAHRLARALARVRAGGDEPDPASLRLALREVIGRCCYGIDANEMAIELAKVSLWIEALEPGRPLSFLDHHLAWGNALLGTTPALLAGGVPDDAFQPITGDDRGVAAAWRKTNQRQRAGQHTLDLALDAGAVLAPVAAEAAAIDALPDDTLARVAAKAQRFSDLQNHAQLRRAALAAHAWCAAFVAPKVPGAPIITSDTVLRAATRGEAGLDPAALAEIRGLAARYQFLHWHLAFPGVLRLPAENQEPDNPVTGWSGGFDVVLGNPPWEQTQLEEKQFFAGAAPEIAGAAGSRRKAMIAALEAEDQDLFAAYRGALRQADGVSRLLRATGRFPLTGRGRINTYAVFAEAMRAGVAPTGRAGIIVPTGIATDHTTKDFFADLVERSSLVSLYDFENRDAIFPGVHRSYKFALVTLTGRGVLATEAELAFFCHQVADLAGEGRRFFLSAEDLALLNPNTRTCPVFRSERDAELTKSVYRRVPVLVDRGPPALNPWGVTLRQGLFNMTSDSQLFRTAGQSQAEGAALEGNVYRAPDGRAWLPLYEAKMVHHFDHRWASYEGDRIADLTAADKDDPWLAPLPRYWVEEPEVDHRLPNDRRWLLVLHRICRATDERTVIASPVARAAVGDNMLLVLSGADPSLVAVLGASLCSLALDYFARLKVGGSNLNPFIAEQLPVLPPETYRRPTPWEPERRLDDWILDRVLELSYTAWDLGAFALDLGWDGPPFRWDEDRRALLRAELDACFFHLYGIGRGDVDYILDTFPIVRRRDQSAWGEYRTKRLVLEGYDAMAKATETGQPYQSALDPPPADPAAAHDEEDR